MAFERKGSDGDIWKFYKDAAGEWRWNRKASNGNTVGASTEGYKNFSDCHANAVRHRYDGPKPAP